MARLLAGLMLVLSMLLAALALPAMGGTQADPDVTDPSGDRTIADPAPLTAVPAAVAGAGDLKAGWVTENKTHLFFHIEAYSNIQAGLVQGATPTASYEYEFHFTLAGADLHAAATVAAGGPPTFAAQTTPSELATAASVSGAVLNMTVPKSALSASAPGTLLTGLELTVVGTTATLETVTDEAPSGTGTTRNYTITGGGAPVANPNDTDGDGLNNTFEQTYFGSPTSPQNATGDGDNDGCNNLCEQAHGTDPTKADTDGDGVNDGAEIAAGTNPKDPSSKPSTTTTTTTTSTPSSTPGTTSTTSTSGTTSTGAGTEPSVADKLLKVDAQYLYIAAGGALVVIVLAAIGRFGRWGL